jgi:hypothetical protein
MRAFISSLLMVCCAFSVHGQSSYTQLKKLLDRNVSCIFEGAEVKIDTTIHAESRNVSYSYTYLYPKYFTEIWPKEEVVSEVRKITDAYIDTVTYISPDKQASFKIFAGQVVPFALGKRRSLSLADMLPVEKAVDDCMKLIKAGKDKELHRTRITFMCKGVKGYNYTICVKSSREDVHYLYKVILAEMPATGDLIFSHFLYQYKDAVKNKYEALGVTLANAFKVD